jgi:integrase
MPTSTPKGRIEDFKKKATGFKYNAKTREALFDLKRNGKRSRRLYQATGSGLDAYKNAEKAFLAFRDAVESEIEPTPALTRKTPLGAPERPLLRDYVLAEWDVLTVGIKPSTVKDYRYCTDLLNAAIGDLPIDSITSSDLKRFVAFHQAERSAATINGGLRFLRKVLRHAEEAGHITVERLPRRNPFMREEPLHLELSTAEQAAFLSAFDNEQGFRERIQTKRKSSGKSAVSDRYLSERPFGGGMLPDSEAASIYFDRFQRSKLLFTTALDTGLRLTDLRLLKTRDVDLDGRFISVITGKRGRQAVIALSDRCHEALAEAMSTSRGEHVFTVDGVEPYPESSIRRYFRIVKQIAGITRRFRIHDLRHTFGSNLTSGGVPLTVVASGLGHSSTRMAERYSNTSPAALELMRAALNGAAKRSQTVDSDKALNDLSGLGL